MQARSHTSAQHVLGRQCTGAWCCKLLTAVLVGQSLSVCDHLLLQQPSPVRLAILSSTGCVRLQEPLRCMSCCLKFGKLTFGSTP